jgi:hypothetical protein
VPKQAFEEMLVVADDRMQWREEGFPADQREHGARLAGWYHLLVLEHDGTLMVMVRTNRPHQLTASFSSFVSHWEKSKSSFAQKRENPYML